MNYSAGHEHEVHLHVGVFYPFFSQLGCVIGLENWKIFLKLEMWSIMRKLDWHSSLWQLLKKVKMRMMISGGNIYSHFVHHLLYFSEPFNFGLRKYERLWTVIVSLAKCMSRYALVLFSLSQLCKAFQWEQI